MSTSLGFANLYLARGSKRDRSAVLRILGQYNLSHKDLEAGKVKLDITGETLDQIRDSLVAPIIEYLDPRKRSSVCYLGSDGRLATLIIKDGDLLRS